MTEELFAKLSKIKALADKGSIGERENAEELLAKLLKKYNIKEEELLEDVVSEHEFSYWGAFGKELFYQVVSVVLGKDASISHYIHKNSCKIRFIDCTDAEAIEIKENFEFYRNHLDEGIKNYYHAFVQVEKIFPKDADDSRMSMEEYLEYMESEEFKLQQGMSKHERHLMLEN